LPGEARRGQGAVPEREPSEARLRGASSEAEGWNAKEGRAIQAAEMASGVYAIRFRGLRALLDDPRRSLGALGVGAWPSVGSMGRPALEISSDLADGILTREGLVVTDPKGLAVAGIEAGDILRTVNGHPLSHLYLVVVQLRREPDARVVRLELDRAGARITRAYDIREL
jgi:S1-C subfamily serine protease